eukprot:TRINITY_DN38923_c0_g1_i1.p1 TRINITY_DN38923_c0_g1~~TRINITY_DN38923_c0_g1_i1.p1  ORF type:complete len:626 (+),score=123.83 TRINITY_DN38923_c0_g1_i1:253-2130(+)
MGNKSSRAGKKASGAEHSEETLFGKDLLALQKSFAYLAAQSGEGIILRSHLEDRFRLVPANVAEGPLARAQGLLTTCQRVGPALVDFLYGGAEKVDWPNFVHGTAMCCKDPSSMRRYQLLVALFASFPPSRSPIKPAASSAEAAEPAESHNPTAKGGGEIAEGAEAEEENDEIDLDGAWFTVPGLEAFLQTCWLLMGAIHLPIRRRSQLSVPEPSDVKRLVDVEMLVEGARHYAAEQAAAASLRTGAIGGSARVESYRGGAVGGGEERIPAQQVASWALAVLPGLANCLADFVEFRLIKEAPAEQITAADRVGGKKPGDPASSSEGLREGESSQEGGEPGEGNMRRSTSGHGGVSFGMLSTSTAWALGLSQRGAGETLLGLCCDPEGWRKYQPSLLYRASLHGRGITRFFNRVQGYTDCTLMLLSATTVPSAGSTEDMEGTAGERWAMAAIVPTGFENRDTFYGGSSCCLVAMQPRFIPFRAQGRESNFVYSHAVLPGQGYRAVQRPQGIGFGGSVGKERIWLDEEFATISTRHHAVDNTFQKGELVPGQGYVSILSRVEEVELWGLGGGAAEEKLAAYQARQNLFTEQRAKIDLKKFAGNWEASPEKAMLDFVSDPSRPAREER